MKLYFVNYTIQLQEDESFPFLFPSCGSRSFIPLFCSEINVSRHGSGRKFLSGKQKALSPRHPSSMGRRSEVSISLKTE